VALGGDQRLELLRPCSQRDKRAGYIEAVKGGLRPVTGFLRGPRGRPVKLREFDLPAMQRLIRRCANCREIISPPRAIRSRWGSARPLDFGHWAAHKLEQISEYNAPWRSGPMGCPRCDLLAADGILDNRSAERILKLIEELGFEIYANDCSTGILSGALLVLQGLENFASTSEAD